MDIRSLDARHLLPFQVLHRFDRAVLWDKHHFEFVVVHEDRGELQILTIGIGNQEWPDPTPSQIDLATRECSKLRRSGSELDEIDFETELLEILLAEGDMSGPVHDGLHAGIDA